MTEPAAARARLEEGMVDEIRFEISAAASATVDEETLAVTPGDPDVVYEGMCMITEKASIVRESLRGGEQEYVTRYQVSIPFDGGPVPIGATGVVLESEADPDLPGQRLAAVSVAYGTRAARRRIMCELVTVGPRR